MNITDPRIDEYLHRTLPVPLPILREMEEYGRARDFPIIGPQVGRLLMLLARALHARRVLELGSGFGYSAMWFALALEEGGRVVTTEDDPGNVDRARDYFARAGLSDRVELHRGEALEIARGLTGTFDVILNDIDKADYPATLPVVRERLRLGGMFISDNMLRHGQVVEPDGSPQLRGILGLTHDLLDAPDFVTTILPVRDGVSISLRVA